MSNWLVTLTYNLKETNGRHYQYSRNCFVIFSKEYPTEIEINRLIDKYTYKKELFNHIRQEFESKKTVPTITFMQKLEEVEEWTIKVLI